MDPSVEKFDVIVLTTLVLEEITVYTWDFASHQASEEHNDKGVLKCDSNSLTLIALLTFLVETIYMTDGLDFFQLYSTKILPSTHDSHRKRKSSEGILLYRLGRGR